MPTPTPTEMQIESVREIALLSIFAEAESKINALNDSQWAATVADIAEWAKVKNKFTKIEGGRSGVVIDKEDNRLGIRNRVRVRLGLVEVDENGKMRGNEDFIFPSCTINTKVIW